MVVSEADFPRVSCEYPAKPSGRELTRLDQVIGWMAEYLSPDSLAQHMPPDTGRVMWARASGLPWPRIIQARKAFYGLRQAVGGGKSPIPGGNSHPSLRLIYQNGLAYLAQQLNQHGIDDSTGSE